MAYASRIDLTGYLLKEIEQFERYMGLVWGGQTGSIIFRVEYKDGSRGYVHGGSFISGKPLSETELRDARDKVQAGKDLLGDDEWHYLEEKYQIVKDRVLVLSYT
jgi:hypothetical protein